MAAFLAMVAFAQVPRGGAVPKPVTAKKLFHLGATTSARAPQLQTAGGELVTLPEGVSTEDYTMTIDQEAYSEYGWQSVGGKRTVQVAFDGDDVYLQGLAYWFRDNYVKGTKNADGNYVFKTGQLIGSDADGDEFINGMTYGEEGLVICDYVFDFDAEARTLTLAYGYFLAESDAPDSPDAYTQIYSVNYKPGAYVVPDLVTLPEGVESQTWYLSAYNDYGGGNGEVQVAFDGNDIYLQGLSSALPEAWIKGSVDGNTATFATGQYLGLGYGAYDMFFVGADGSYNVKDVVFNYDAEGGSLKTADYIVVSQDETLSYFYESYMDTEITREKPALPETVTVPDGLQTNEWLFEATRDNYGTTEPYVNHVQVGFDGQDVYIQGLAESFTTGWVKGSLSEDGKTVTFPANQFMGITGEEPYIDEYYFTSVDGEGNLTGVVLDYDAAAGRLSTTQPVYINSTRTRLYPFFAFTDVVMTMKTETADTPATPSVESFYGGWSYSVRFDIPATNAEGKSLITSKLSYQVMVEKDGVEQVLPLTVACYPMLEQDMEEVPYNFEAKWDILLHGKMINLNQGEEEIKTWSKIGVRSIYRGGGEEHTSAIGWYDLEPFWQEMGIEQTTTAVEPADDAWYTVTGVRVAKPAAAGLYIHKGRKVVVR